MPSHRITHIRVENPKTPEHITHVKVSGLGKPFIEPIDSVIESIKEGQCYYIIINGQRVPVNLQFGTEGKEFIKTQVPDAVTDHLMLLPKFHKW